MGLTTIEVDELDVWISLDWSFPEQEKIQIFIEIDKTGQKTDVVCDWDPEDVDYLNPKQLAIMYRDEIKEAVADIFDPWKHEPPIEDDHWDFYHDKL